MTVLVELHREAMVFAEGRLVGEPGVVMSLTFGAGTYVTSVQTAESGAVDVTAVADALEHLVDVMRTTRWLLPEAGRASG